MADTATISYFKAQAELYMDRPGTDPADVGMALFIADRLAALSARQGSQQGRGVSRLLHAKIYRQTGETEKGKQASREAVSLLAVPGMPRLYAEALIELGGTLANNQNDLPEKIRLYEQGIAIFAQLGEKREVAGLKEFLGDLLQIHREYGRAIKVLHESLALYRELGHERLHGVYSLLGDAYHGANNFVESLRYCLLAVETAEKLGEDGPLRIAVVNRLGLNYYTVRYFDQAIECFNKSLRLAHQSADTASIVFLRLNIADALHQLGRYHQSLDTLTGMAPVIDPGDKSSLVHTQIIAIRNYIALGRLREAENCQQQLRRYDVLPDVPESIRQVISLNIAAYFQAKGRFAQSRHFLDQFERSQQRTTASLSKRLEAAKLQYRADSALGNLRSALQRFHAAAVLGDSLTSLQQARQMGVLQLQFETRHKDESIQLLTQKNHAQEAVIRKAAVVRNVIVGSVALLVIIICLLYNRYRLKKRSHLQAVRQQAEINDQNIQLKKLIEEREWLLREIHHRVKNNLQIVISLLNTQSQYLDSADAISAIRNSQHRMHAMSLIHQRLYQTDNLGSIDMKWYISELVSHMKDSFGTKGKILFTVDCDRVLLDVVQAVPLGLILNEAVSNAIKYAFPGNREGAIGVSFHETEDGRCRLMVGDDGVGFPAGGVHTQSLGMSLMYGLAEQLDGDIRIDSTSAGVTVTVAFRRQLPGSPAL